MVEFSLLQAILDDLHSSRQAQKAAKLVQQAEMAEREKGEFERIIAVNRVKEAQSAKLASQVHFVLPLLRSAVHNTHDAQPAESVASSQFILSLQMIHCEQMRQACA